MAKLPVEVGGTILAIQTCKGCGPAIPYTRLMNINTSIQF